MSDRFTASWINNRPAYWIDGTRVARDKGYKHACEHNIELPEQFHQWHLKNS